MAENFKNIKIEDAISYYFTLSKCQKSEVLKILIAESGIGLSSWVHRIKDWSQLKKYKDDKMVYREIFLKTIARLHGEAIEEQLQPEQAANEN